MSEIKAEICGPTSDIRADIAFFTKILGFKMDMIYPADDPQVAVFSGFGVSLRLDQQSEASPITLHLRCDEPADLDGLGEQIAPGGTIVHVTEMHPPLALPQTLHSFVVRRLADQSPWIVGRAGMHYRDLIPDRLGGSIIASHIRIPDGGPVPDMVHYHTVGFQLIFCYRGWVDLVYEDQGEPFRLYAGNCVIQPPEIRHRVLFASDNIEVIEIGVPAEHVTTIDHTMELPNGPENPDRVFQGQKFVHHKAETAEWQDFRLKGFKSRDTLIAQNTQNVAGVHVVKPSTGAPEWAAHDSDIHFTFVMEGSMTLEGDGRDPHRLEAGDAFVTPPAMLTRYADASDDLELLEVSVPGTFKTWVGDPE